MAFIVGTVSAPINADTRPFSAGLTRAHGMGSNFINQMSGSMQKFGEGMKSMGSNLTKYVTLPLAAAATGVLKLGKDFETELSKVVGLVGVSKKQVDEWGNEILKLGPKIGKAPKELAEALFFVTSAGIKGAESLEVLEMAGKASTAGLGETKTIADLVTSAMNAYGKENLSAANATDILVAAVREGKAEASELAASMGQVLPLASELGVTFDQVAATQAAMTRTGTNASEAATQLKSIMAGVIKPSKQAKEQLTLMGTSAAELRKKIRDEGLLTALMDLRKMTNKYGEEAMAKVFPNIRALMGVLDLMGSNLESNKEVFKNVANSTGILDDAFAAASDTVDFRFNKSLSQVKSFGIGFFDTLKALLIPVLEKFTSVISFANEKLNSMPEGAKKIIVGFLGIAAAIGPVLVIVGTAIASLGAVIGGVSAGISAITAVLSIGAPVLLAIAAGIAQITIVIGVVIGAISALIASFVYLWKTNDEFRENVINTWNQVKDNAKIIFNDLKNIISNVISKIQDFWSKHGDKILSIIEKAFNLVLKAIRKTMESIKSIVKLASIIVEGDWDKLWNTAKEITQKALDSINDKINEFKQNIINKFNELKSGIENKFNEIKKGIIDFFESMPARISEYLVKWKESIIAWAIEQNEENQRQFESWKETIVEWFNSIPDRIRNSLNAWKDSIKNKFDEMIQSIKDKFALWGETIQEWFNSIPSKISNFLDGWWESIKESFNKAKIMIEEKLEEWWGSIKGWFSSLSEKKEIRNAGQNVIKKVSDGVQDKKEKKDFMDKLGKLIVDIAKNALLLAGVVLIATGREIIKRIISGVSSINLRETGRNIIQSLIDGIKSMYGKVENTAYSVAKKIRDFFPFSPAKKGPLKNLDKIDFSSQIMKSLKNAEKVVNNNFLGNVLFDGVNNRNFGSNESKSVQFNGSLNFYGVQNVSDFMKEMKDTVQRVGGKF